MTQSWQKAYPILFLVFILLSGCSQGGTPLGLELEPTMVPEKTSSFRIIGYAPAWDTVVQEVQFDKLTHINYAFLLPKPDGSFKNLEHPQKLKDLVTEAHKHGVKVLISIGGWGYDEQFETLAADPNYRAVFVQEALRFATLYNLDGIDIDWEYPDAGESAQNFLDLMKALRTALPEGMLLTSAVVSRGSNAEGIPAEVFPEVDFLNIMVYDESQTDHSPYWLAEESLNYWLSRGLPPEKTVLGVPFYGRPEGIPYRKLVQADPTAAERDASEYEGEMIYYNGMETMQRKTELAMQRASGIMIWELAHDTADATSLLGVISRTVESSK
jgi:GH18 family chitinase